MSWKSLITAGLFCLLASPVFAVGPTETIVKGGGFASGYLNANGDWVWTVQIAPDQGIVPDATGTPMAAELGFTSSKAGATAAVVGGGVFDTPNPGKKIFGTEPNSASTGNPAANFDGAIVVNGAGTTISTAIGSSNVTGSTARDYITITVPGPSTANLTSTITTSGAYSGLGRIAQINGGTSGGPYTTGNFDTFNVVAGKTAKAGDADLNDSVDAGDFGTWLANFGNPSTPWYNGDFDNNNSIDSGDFGIWLANFGSGAGAGSGLSSGGGGGTVPEPASIALIGLASLMVTGLRLRKR